MTASHPAPSHVLSRVAPSFLAADVGGTHVRVARVQASGDTAHPVQVLEYRKYRNADHAGLSAILSDFLGEGPRPTHCVVASAGYARDDGTVITANLPWPLSARQVEADVGLQRVYIVNDFEAVAYAAAQVDASGVLHLCGPDTGTRGPTLVVGPGTGLGVALLVGGAGHWQVVETEGGHVSFAPLGEEELTIARWFTARFGRVSNERLLCGSGLSHIDAVLRGASAKEHTASTRMLGLVDQHLLWAWDLAALGQGLESHASARLTRIVPSEANEQ